MLNESNLFGPVDKIKIAIDYIKRWEQDAISFNPGGYWVAFSGGKDSIVILDLVRRAGVKHTVHFNLTTVDPPELIRYIHKFYPDISIDRPEMSMWKLIVKQKSPPTMMHRYCCRVLKERGGDGHYVVLGLRREESNRRRNRTVLEVCSNTPKGRYLLSPIVDWTEEEVWQYIHSQNLSYCCLYDEGFHRVGCVGCPMGRHKGMLRDFARWPGFERSYRRAFQLAFEELKKNNMKTKWTSGDNMFEWWINLGEKGESEYKGFIFE